MAESLKLYNCGKQTLLFSSVNQAMQGFVDSGREVLDEAKLKWKENTEVLAAVSMLSPCVVPSEMGEIVFVVE